MSAQPILETNRLVLRPFKLSDAEQVQKLANKIEVASTINLPHPHNLEMATGWIKTHEADFQEGRNVKYAITLKDSGELIGTISLMDFTRQSNHARIGFWIGLLYWNIGYCTTRTGSNFRIWFCREGAEPYSHRLYGL